jgi:ribose transport system permease protein
MEMDAIAAVVIGGTPLIGGKGKVMGTVFGCLIVGVINNALNLSRVDSNWQLIAKGALILIAVLLDVVTETYFQQKLKKA